MATFCGVLNEKLKLKIDSSNILVVGAGGIGCELLKDLVLTGFKEIKVIDLDTIDVSNLNRQFLFRKEHVGRSKAEVARDSALRFNPDANITAYHDSVMSAEYGTDFFSKFDVVMNALDNRAARNHVNRMCLAANVPLIESGTAGYLGQVTVIKKGLTECYECQPKPAQKTFPGCTIRNTPSEPIHCIVWAKHLFNQLFGESDPDQDVSPDTEDPEAAGDAGQAALGTEASVKTTAVGGIERKSTHIWAEEQSFDFMKLFNKFFRDDIRYLLSMANLWKTRQAPTPLDLNKLPDSVVDTTASTTIRDQRVWSLRECADVFKESLAQLRDELSQGGQGAILVWDKDNDSAMNFVTSAANIRAYIFGISPKSRFDIKSMAGNIIPAIATTNAIIAGLIVMEGLKILSGQIEKCATVYLNRHANARKKLLVPCALDKPNPKCYVCSEKPEVTVQLNTLSFTVKALEEKVLKSALGMVAPDVEIDDGKGTILISSEEGETEENGPRSLSTFGIATGTRLKCDDFLQEYNLNIHIIHVDKLADELEFELIGDTADLQPHVDASPKLPESATISSCDGASTSAGDGASASFGAGQPDDSKVLDDDDELMIMDEVSEEEEHVVTVDVDSSRRKRKAVESGDDSVVSAKKICINAADKNNGHIELD